MTHEDAGHYAAKHPSGAVADPAVAAAIEARAHGERITCAAAFSVADDLGISPSEVGVALDLLEYRIVQCRLGLFGYSPDKKIVKAAAEVPAVVARELKSIASDERVSCASCWNMAEISGMEKMAIAAVCESLDLKIGPCQLGAF